jgi:xylulokinase
MACLIGLDIGTTSTAGIMIGLPDRVLGLATRPVGLRSERPGWAEEDPRQWWSNVCEVIRELLELSGVPAEAVGGVCAAGMLPAVVLLDRENRLLRPSIQQSDGRCADEVAELRAEIGEPTFLSRTGNGINQQLAAGKLRWLEKHEPAVFGQIATVFGSYDYIGWRLTGERVVEQNWALESGFVEIANRRVCDDLVSLAHIPRPALPRVVAAHEIIGRVTPEAASATGLLPGTPVMGGAADLIASALAAGVHRAGDVLLKFGGSVDVLTASDRVLPDPRMYIDYHLIPDLYVPNGCMSTGGSGLNWFAANFAGGLTPPQLDRLAQDIPAGSDGVSILPYFLGEKSPIHDPGARGVICGLSLSHRQGHIWRALLESYAYAIAHNVEVLGEIGHRTDRFAVSDGGSQSDVWMQIVSDVLQRPLRRLAGHPGSCLGAAWTAAIGSGLVSDWGGVSGFVGERAAVEFNPRNGDTYARGYRTFREIYRSTRALIRGSGYSA